MWGLAVNPFPSVCFPDGPLPKGPLDTEKDDDSGSAAANAPPPTLHSLVGATVKEASIPVSVAGAP